MVYGLWLSAGGMAANQYRQNVAANNLANINTVGFKHDLAMLVERPIEVREDTDMAWYANALLDRLTGGTHVSPTVHTWAQGPTQTTGKPLDALIEGPGFFEVQTAEGPRYTRNGQFALAPDGTLVTVTGKHAVLDEDGQVIQVGPGPQPAIDHEGRITQGGQIVATLGVVEFDDLSAARKQGASLYMNVGQAAPHSALASHIVPGAVEGSTMDPVTGLVDMIEASRAFQINANLLSLQDATMGRAVNDIARV